MSSLSQTEKIRKGQIIKQKDRNHKICATKLVLATFIGVFISTWFTVIYFYLQLFNLETQYLNYTAGEGGGNLFSCAQRLRG